MSDIRVKGRFNDLARVPPIDVIIFLESLKIAPRFFLLSEMPFKDPSLPIVQVALDRLSTAGAPGIDGNSAFVFRVFSDVFCRRLLEEIKIYMNGGTPSYDLLMGLMYRISKTK